MTGGKIIEVVRSIFLPLPVFCRVKPCRLLCSHRSFVVACCPTLQDRLGRACSLQVMSNGWGKSRMGEWTKGSVGALALYNGFWLTYSAQGDDKTWQKDLTGDKGMWEKCVSKRWGLGWVEMKPNVEQEGGNQPIQDSHWVIVIFMWVITWYKGVLISSYHNLLLDVVGRNR